MKGSNYGKEDVDDLAFFALYQDQSSAKVPLASFHFFAFVKIRKCVAVI